MFHSVVNKALSVSIVIPAYNEEDHLRACLLSIQQQTVQPAEVIVVDNNSTDATVSIAAEFPFARTVNEKQQGIFYARNAGFEAATSDIIGRIDADTVLPPDWVERVVAFYEDPPHQDHAFTGGAYFYNVPLRWLSSWVLDQVAFRMNRVLMGHYIVHGSNMAFPRKLWVAVRDQVCARTDIHEDLDLAIHLHRAGFPITYHSSLRVGLMMRRVFENAGDRWGNLRLWPQTLRVHGLRTWVLGYAGAMIVQAMSPLMYVLDVCRRIAQRITRP